MGSSPSRPTPMSLKSRTARKREEISRFKATVATEIAKALRKEYTLVQWPYRLMQQTGAPIVQESSPIAETAPTTTHFWWVFLMATIKSKTNGELLGGSQDSSPLKVLGAHAAYVSLPFPLNDFIRQSSLTNSQRYLAKEGIVHKKYHIKYCLL